MICLNTLHETEENKVKVIFFIVTVIHNYNMELHVLCIHGIVLSICICQAYSHHTSQMAVAVAHSVQ